MLYIFDGTLKNYAGWQKYFIATFHIQDTNVVHKCMALDASVTQTVKDAVFKDLSLDANGYYLRVKRLEEMFGRPEQQLDAMLKDLDCVKHLTDSAESINKVRFTIEKYMFSGYCSNPHDPHLALQIKRTLKKATAAKFYEYCVIHKKDEGLLSLLG